MEIATDNPVYSFYKNIRKDQVSTNGWTADKAGRKDWSSKIHTSGFEFVH
jgi:hypothetical protein